MAHGMGCAAKPPLIAAVCVRILTAGLFAFAPLLAAGALHVGAAARHPSAVGDETPLWITVSPAYPTTHMVVAVTVPMGGCSGVCMHLWITRDGGASWQRRGGGVALGAPQVGVDEHGHEVLVAQAAGGVERSDDDGATWQVVGPPGVPSIAPSFVADGGVVAAVPKGSDYRATARQRTPVPGSRQSAVDLVFAFAGGGGGRFAPALLAAADPATGAPMVLRCDADLSCGRPGLLPGATQLDSGDVDLVPAPDFRRSGMLFVRTAGSVFRSTDGGTTFVRLVLPLPPAASVATVSRAVLAADAPARLYVAEFDVTGHGESAATAGGVYSSGDDGASWSAVGSPGPVDSGATALAVAPDGRLFAGYVGVDGGAGLVCSEGGRAWGATCGRSAGSCGSSCTARPSVSGATARGVGLTPASSSGGATSDRAVAPMPAGPAGVATGAAVETGRSAARELAPVALGLAVAVASAALVSRRRRSQLRRPSA